MKTKPSAFYCGQHDETLEHMVIIEDTEKCECLKPWCEPHPSHTCFRYFSNVQEAIAFEVSFNRRNAL